MPRMTQAQFNALQEQFRAFDGSLGKREGRYPNIKRVQLDGYTFASKAEAERYLILKAAQLAGSISGLRVHPHYDFRVNGSPVGRGYTADFCYSEMRLSLSVQIVEDVKGPVERDWPLRRDLFLALYQNRVLLVNGVEVKRRKA